VRTQTKPGTTRDRALERGIQSEDLRRAFRCAKRSGWGYKMAGSTHLILTNPTGARVSISTTAQGNTNAAMAKLKKMGLVIE